jgi:hypothetical protein
MIQPEQFFKPVGFIYYNFIELNIRKLRYIVFNIRTFLHTCEALRSKKIIFA